MMSSVDYREPCLIWTDGHGNEQVIADLSWMLSDYGSAVLHNPQYYGGHGRYIQAINIVQAYTKEKSQNVIAGVIAIVKTLEKANDCPGMSLLYVGEDDILVKYMYMIIKLLSANHVVNLKRCTLSWRKGNQYSFFYGGSSKVYRSFTDEKLGKKSYSRILCDTHDDGDLYNKLFELLDDNGNLVMFSKTAESLQDRYGKVYGDVNVGYWQFCRNEKYDFLIRVRKSRIDKMIALLKNLKDEMENANINSFEDKYFLSNCRKIVLEEAKSIGHSLAVKQDDIKELLYELYEMMDFVDCKDGDEISNIHNIENKIDEVLNVLCETPVNRSGILAYNEKNIEFILKHDLLDAGPWEYHFEEDKLHFYNWFPTGSKDEWWYRFIVNNVPSRREELNFYSVQGDDLRVRFMNKKNKVFYALEDECKRFMDYRDFCISSVDLIITHKKLSSDKSLELPYWILAIFEPILDIKKIRSRIDDINNARSTCKYECALIASHDMYMNRSALFNDLNDVLDIQCPGKFNNNTDLLKNKFADDKREYLKNFMFCACPENVSVKGWVTEKIFDAFCCGSIPIYYGAHNNPCPGIINKDAVLFYKTKGGNSELRKIIHELKNSENIYRKFISQKKLLKGTDEYVYDYMQKVQQKLRELSR